MRGGLQRQRQRDDREPRRGADPPESTVEFEEGKSYVYVLTSAEGAEEQTFEKREVQLGLSDGINIEIKEGVTAGEKIRGAKEDKKKK